MWTDGIWRYNLVYCRAGFQRGRWSSRACRSAACARLLDAPPAPALGRAPHRPDTPARPVWQACIARLLAAVVGFDEVRLNAVYNEALTLGPVDLVHEHAIPLMGLLGERWSQHRGGIAEEHVFSTYLRNKLGARSHHLLPAPGGQVLVTACVPDERHDLGLLLFSHGARARGHRVVMLDGAVPS